MSSPPKLLIPYGLPLLFTHLEIRNCNTVQSPSKTLADWRIPLQIPSHPNIWIARVIGIIAIASGFVLGIEGLDQPDSIWLPTALGLILTGLCAQGYAFYRTITDKMHPQDKKDS